VPASVESAAGSKTRTTHGCLKLEKQLDKWLRTADPPRTVVCCGVRVRLDGSIHFIPEGGEITEPVPRRLIKGNFIITQTVLMPTELFLAHRFDEQLRRFQDWELWLRLCSQASFIGVDDHLVLALETDDSITRSTDLVGPSLAHILHRHSDLFRRDPESFRRFSRLAATGLLKQGDLIRSARWFWKWAAACGPRSIDPPTRSVSRDARC
jgi:hypothetical protein